MPTAASLFFAIVTGALGVAYIMYGRRRTRLVPVVCGIALCSYSYFIDNWIWLCVVGAALLIAPFLLDL